MALGFKVADGYVEVHARYNKGEVRKAAQDAADDNDRAFNKERENNSRSGATRDTNRKIGRQASVDFVHGMHDNRKGVVQEGRLAGRQSGLEFAKNFVVMQDYLKKHPIIKVDDVKRDASRLGRVHVNEFARSAENEVDRRRSRFRQIGRRVSGWMFGKDNAARAATNFFKAFAEAITFGQADFSRPIISGPLTKIGAAMGTVLGVSLAAALVVQIGQAITALLPLALGAALIAVPIADIIARNVSLEKGKLSFKKNDMGQTIKHFIRQAQELADKLGKVFGPAFQAGLESATRLMEAIEKPLTRVVRAITPGVMAMWNGLLGGIIAFGKAFQPAIVGINAGLKQWGIEFPKIGKALGQMFATILKNPELVRNAVKGLSITVQFLLKLLGVAVTVVTYALGAWRNLWRLAGLGVSMFAKWIGLPGILSRIWHALLPLRKALLDAWEAFKKFATASNDKQALERFKVLLDKIKKVWDALKPILVKALQVAWDKLKAFWNAHVVPWWNNHAKPYLKKKLEEVAKAAFAALVKMAVAELKKLPGKVKDWLKKTADKVKEELKKAADKAKEKAKELVDKFVQKVKELPGKAKAAVSSLASKVGAEFTQAVTKAKQKAKDLVDGFIKKVKELPGKAKTAVGKVKGAVTGALSGAGTWLVSAGKALMSGLADGIRKGLTWVKNAAITAAKAAVGAAKKALGISSPSKVAAEQVGKPIAQGIGVGMKKQMPDEMKGLAELLPSVRGMSSGNTYQTSSSFSPTIHVHVAAGLDPVDAAARRALVKGLYLETEKFRKDYVDR